MSIKVRKAKKKIDWTYVTENPGIYVDKDGDAWILTNSLNQTFYLCVDGIELADEDFWDDSKFEKFKGSIDITIEGEEE